MAESTILLELTLIIGIAAILALVGRMIKQPTIIAYLLTGILIGPLFFNLLKSTELIQIFAHIGVAFLLFIIGLSLDFRVLKEVGKVALVVGIGQMLITGIFGYFIAVALGFGYIPALFIAAALAISSTVVVMKLLTDKKELDSLHGKISVGILIVQDFAAVIILMLIPIVGTTTTTIVFWEIAKGALLIAGIFVVSHLVIPGVLSVAARNQEVLFLFSLGWALLIAILFEFLGFSIEVGALVAGMALASSKFSIEIGSKVKGLREFFVIIHLVFFGSLLVGPITSTLLVSAVLLSLFVLIGNPIIVMTFMRMFGYKKQTNFMTGISIAQISEFSLILVLLGFSLGAVSQKILSLVILIALITIALSSYSIYYSRPLYNIFAPVLGLFDGKGKVHGTAKKSDKFDVMLFGYNRIGFNLVRSLRKAHKKFVIIDYNPKTIEKLTNEGIPCIYGDANDPEFIKELKINTAKILISTVPVFETNLQILKEIKSDKVIFIPTSHHIKEALKLYAEGADYVIMPHFLGGNFMGRLLIKDNFDKKLIDKEGEKQLHELRERLHEGHDHPHKDGHGH